MSVLEVIQLGLGKQGWRQRSAEILILLQPKFGPQSWPSVVEDGPTSHQLGISFALFLFSSQLGTRCVIHKLILGTKDYDL